MLENHLYRISPNQNTKIYDIVNYLLKMSTDNSKTWSIFLRQLFSKYGLNDPLLCLRKDPPEKSAYKEHILTKITAFYENELIQHSLSNYSMTHLNVSVTGLNGKHHPALANLLTTFDIQKSRTHLKMLCQDYLTYEKRADQSGGSPVPTLSMLQYTPARTKTS